MNWVIVDQNATFITASLRLLDPAVMVACTGLFYAKAWLVPGELARVLAIFYGLLVMFGFFGLCRLRFLC